MNKKITLSALTILMAAWLSLPAQLITISATNQFPTNGDTIHYVDANTFGFNPAGTGPVTNVLWDNTFLLNAGTTYQFYYVNPSSITGNGVDSFPNATIARGESGAAGYFYYQNTASDINRIGWFGSNTNYGIYENGTFATEFHFPITAGQTFNSTYNGRYAPFGVGEDSVKIESGTLTINADQQGTMILPTGTFTNVLRIHALENFHIKIYLLGVPVIDYVVSDDYYYWFHDTVLQPIMIYGITTVDGTLQTPVLRYQPLSGTTGVNQLTQRSNIEVYPNPSNGRIIISGIENNLTNSGIDIYNSLGQKVDFQTTVIGNTTSINLTDAAKGIYVVTLTVNNKSVTRKISVE